MEYILFAFLALFASAGNTIFNRLGANKASALTNATVKSFFIVIACFLISLAFGHITILYSLTPTQWIWISVIGVLTAIDWFFYFLAIKKSHLEAFAPFVAAGVLFLSNSLFSIFTFALVTNGGKVLNIILYFIGLASLLGSIIFIVLNKQINPTQKWLWVIFATIACISFAFVLLIVKVKLSDVAPDVISFQQMSIVFVIMLIASLVTKSFKEIVHISWKDHLFIFSGAVFNALTMVFRYKAFSYPNSVPAIVNIIIALDFVIVSLATIIFFKAKNKLQMSIVISLVLAGMILDVVAGLI